MHNKLDPNLAKHFVDVENMTFPYVTLYMYMTYVNFDPKKRKLFFNGSFRFVQHW